GTPDNFPGPGSITQATPTLSTFSGDPNGGWKLYVVDDLTGDVGFIGNWSITFATPSPVTFSPLVGLFTDAAATVPYTGTPTLVVYAKPVVTTPYIASATVNGCTGTATMNVTVNQLPAITVQPAPAAQTICPGFTVTYSVTATGAGLTYQWKLGATNLVDNVQVNGSNTNTLRIFNVSAANSGSYTVVVSGTCAPPVTSTAAVLTVATAPVISTQPVNVTVCAGANASFTVATVGSVPAATIYQWQVSTDAGATFTNVLTGGSFTPTLTVTGTTVAQNNSRYRVLVTNTCGQTTTSAAAILTVNALPVVTATALSKICISDTVVALSGQPVGGFWTGIGVSGFNFIPGATAVGTYTLTYSFTNALGCSATASVIAKVEDCQERLRLLSDDKALLIYPNPNNGRFNVKINTTLYNFLGMKVYNAQGQLVNGVLNNEVLTSPVYTGLVYGRVIPIDLSRLPNGVYLVKFYYDGGSHAAERGVKVVISGH
ncbi:MAG: T9SS type A sorting domain-containing protein, partial [Bacteroidota bacterium]